MTDAQSLASQIVEFDRRLNLTHGQVFARTEITHLQGGDPRRKYDNIYADSLDVFEGQRGHQTFDPH